MVTKFENLSLFETRYSVLSDTDKHAIQWFPTLINTSFSGTSRAVRQAFYLINNALRVRSHKKLRAWIFEVLLSQIRKQNVD
jgi:hypothetical protein